MISENESRADSMVRIFGEVCSKSQAARILSCSTKTVSTMLDDGRLDYACAGEKVDVRSIARYIEKPKEHDFEAHKRKMCKRQGVNPMFSV